MECPPRGLDIEKSACSIIVETLALAHAEDAMRLQDGRLASAGAQEKARDADSHLPQADT